MAMDSEKLACNRIPFLSDSSCNRGDVDITTFDSFPLCQPIDPTPPAIGVPQVDFTIVPIQAPPCACANVNITGNGKSESRSDVKVNGSFKSIGDCCEGNYTANIDVSVPCVPFTIDGGDADREIDIKQVCGLDEPEGTINPGIKVNKCTISINPKVKLSIPKPVETSFDPPELEISSHCEPWYGGSFEFERKDESCRVTFKPKLHLSVPKISRITACHSGDVDQNVFFADSGPDERLTGSGRLHLGGSYDSCDNLTYFCPTLDLNIPCPIKLQSTSLGANKGKAKIKGKIRWKSEESYESSISASFLEQDFGECNLKYVEHSLDLGLPCPIKDPLKVKAKIGWGDGQDSVSASIAEKDSSTCQLKSTMAPIDLKIPCPVNIDPLHLKIHVTTGATAQDGEADILVPKSDNSCGLVAGNRQITIRVPTGGGGGGGVSGLDWYFKKETEEFCISITNLDGTTIETCKKVEAPEVVYKSEYNNNGEHKFENYTKKVYVFGSEDAAKPQEVFTTTPHSEC